MPDDGQKIPEDFHKKSLKTKSGDLLCLWSEYFLCLGPKVSFEELYEKVEALKTSKIEVCCKWFFDKRTMELLHWMVETYYTTYKSVVKHFVTDELEKLLERETKTKDQRGKTKDEKETVSLPFTLSSFICSQKGQTLIVFPDLRTMSNRPWNIETIWQWGVILLASQTQNQKDVHRWEIKKGIKSVILCTYAEIFQDFHDLQKIIWIDPHKWYYANQQDPRYKVGEVLKKLAELWWAELEISGI